MTATVHKIGAARKLTIDELRALAAGAGFPDPIIAAAVAMAESAGDPGVIGDVDLGISIGLWQINTKAHPDLTAAGDLKDPVYNAKAALAVSKGGTTWQPWTTYRTGAYRAFLGDGKASTGKRVDVGGSVVQLLIAAALAWWIFKPSRRPRRRRRLAA